LTQGQPRIGVFGSACDPPHNAHLALVQAALSQLSLDALIVFPTGRAWHKSRSLSPAADRLAMARLAFAHCPTVTVDAREMLRSGPTYTIDTLVELQAEHPNAQLVLILGGDQAAALPTWHRWQDILKIAIISVAFRDPLALESADFHPQNPLPDLPGGRFQTLQMPPMDLSATDVRRRIAAGLGIDHLVPAGVARYIDQHHLYLAP
jgi:nicotinate-nucleotide adenylyltransferase